MQPGHAGGSATAQAAIVAEWMQDGGEANWHCRPNHTCSASVGSTSLGQPPSRWLMPRFTVTTATVLTCAWGVECAGGEGYAHSASYNINTIKTGGSGYTAVAPRALTCRGLPALLRQPVAWPSRLWHAPHWAAGPATAAAVQCGGGAAAYVWA